MTIGELYNYLSESDAVYITQGDMVTMRFGSKSQMPMHLKDCYIYNIGVGYHDDFGEYISIELLY